MNRKSISTYVSVEVDLDEFDDHQLIEECKRRSLVVPTEPEKKTILGTEIIDVDSYEIACDEMNSNRFGKALIYFERAIPAMRGLADALKKDMRRG